MSKDSAVIYARVSTVLGQDPEHQLVPCKQLADGRGLHLKNQYVDFMSGTSDKRKELSKLISDAKRGKFRVVIIYALDRLARDTRFLLNLLHELDSYGVRVISLRESLDFSSENPISKALVQIIGAVAELERNLISERIKTALAVKKKKAKDLGNGWRCGRKPLSRKTTMAVRQLRSQGHSIRGIAKKLNIGKTSVERILRGYR